MRLARAGGKSVERVASKKAGLSNQTVSMKRMAAKSSGAEKTLHEKLGPALHDSVQN
jgi:hypothetical protein